MVNSWIQHVKNCADEYGINYPQAMKDPRTKASYNKMKGGAMCSGGKISRIKKANKWTDYAYNTVKKGIHLGEKGAKAYARSARKLA